MTTKSMPWLCLATFLLSATPALAEQVGIAAIVNDAVITTTDVTERRDLIMASNNMPMTPANIQRITPRIVQSLIDETLQLEEAKRLSISVKKEEIESAIRQMEESRRAPAGTLRESFRKQGLSERSLDAQLRAQIAWNKVVQRKLRREVTITADEVARAQQAAAADPGAPEVRIAAISVLVASPQEEAAQAAFAQQISDQIRAGTPMGALFEQLSKRNDVRLSPPGWIAEEKLQPAMQQALRGMKDGEVTPPLKSLNTYQLVQVLERRLTKKVPENTEVVLKEIALPVPAKPDQKAVLALRAMAEQVRANPGECVEGPVGTPEMNASVKFRRLTMGQLPPELRAVVGPLGVTEVSAPMLTEDALRLFMVCERIEPAQGNLPPAAEVRRQLFNEKIELEAQKHLRNLKRDAFIEIKSPALAKDAS